MRQERKKKIIYIIFIQFSNTNSGRSAKYFE